MPRSDAGALPPMAVALILFLCACWGFNMVAVKLAGAGIPPVLQSGLRSLIATACMLLWCWGRGVRLGPWRSPDLVPGVISGLLFAVEFLALFLGVSLTTASRAVVFIYIAPFVVTAGAHWLAPEDRLTPTKLAGLSIAFLGLALALGEGWSAPEGSRALLGDALCLLAGVLWAATTLILKLTPLRRARPERALLYHLALSAPLLLAASPLFGEAWSPALTHTVLGALLYQSAGIAFATYLAWTWLVQRHSASRLSAFTVMTPVFGVAAGALVLGEALGPLFLGAVVLVAIGLWLVNRPVAA